MNSDLVLAWRGTWHYPEHGNRMPCHADVLLELANQECHG